MKNHYYLILIAVTLWACSDNRLKIDVSQVKVNPVKIERMETDLFQNNTPIIQLQQQLKKKYDVFFLSFQSSIASAYRDSSTEFNLSQFISDSIERNVYRDCERLYPNLDNLESSLTEEYKHFRYYFPKRKLPRVITYISGFNFKLNIVDTIIGISLDMYLGSNNRYYKMMPDIFPKYKTMSMRKENIITDFTMAWLLTEFPKNQDKKDLLSEIIYNGKLLYLEDALLPQIEDSVKMCYTPKQWNYCKTNEYNMWAYFVQNKLLYDSDPSEIVKFTTDAPFTAAFNKNSPSRVGNWIGWRIVCAYMKKHPKVTLEDLMSQRDAQLILAQSNYKPSK